MKFYTEEQVRQYAQALHEYHLWSVMGKVEPPDEPAFPEPIVFQMKEGEGFVVDLSKIPVGYTANQIVQELRQSSVTTFQPTQP